MLKFAFEGITSLSISIKPIRMITWLGILFFCVSIAVIIHFIVRHYTGYTITGWSSTIVSLWAIGGLILFSIGKIYLETKQMPKYHIEQFLSQKDFDEK
ncbi:hypothetical protein FACS189494_03930 [Spirochaetia bacterium]|nr:hypothetical protein FACS189494_03930 [Spirochaetia bacterium]